VSPQLKIPVWKRGIDIVGSLLALPTLGLIMLVVAVIMKLRSPGPVLFRQVRVGVGGRHFMCYKIRTMLVSADPAAHETHLARLIAENLPLVKMDTEGDKRLIPVGWLLRASGLDELAQVLNVLKGDMTLVGPRPCVPFEYPQFLPEARARFNVLPGLTGLWQVSGKNKTTFNEMIALDLEYVRRISLASDLWIMLRTIPTLFGLVADARRRFRPNLNRALATVLVPQSVAEPVQVPEFPRPVFH